VFPNVSVDVLREVLAVDSPILTIHSDINQSGLLKGGGRNFRDFASGESALWRMFIPQ